MRILADEMFDDRIAQVLRALGHEVVLVRKRYRRAKDQRLAAIAKDFDFFLTLDLHRQESEWMAVNHQIVYAGIRVVRLKLPKDSKDFVLDVVRALTAHMERWIAALELGAYLVTISQGGEKIRTHDRAQVWAMIEARLSSTTQPVQLPLVRPGE